MKPTRRNETLTPDALEAIFSHAEQRFPCRGQPFPEDDWKWCLRFAQLSILTAGESLEYAVPQLLGVTRESRRLAHLALRSVRRMKMVRSWRNGRRIKNIASREQLQEVLDKLAGWLVAHMKSKTA